MPLQRRLPHTAQPPPHRLTACLPWHTPPALCGAPQTPEGDACVRVCVCACVCVCVPRSWRCVSGSRPPHRVAGPRDEGGVRRQVIILQRVKLHHHLLRVHQQRHKACSQSKRKTTDKRVKTEEKSYHHLPELGPPAATHTYTQPAVGAGGGRGGEAAPPPTPPHPHPPPPPTHTHNPLTHPPE